MSVCERLGSAIQFEEKVKKDQEAFLASWVAFISLQKEEKIPYPELYDSAFRQALKHPNKENEILELLSKGKDIFGAFMKKLNPKVIRDLGIEKELRSMAEYMKQVKKLEEELNALRETCLRDEMTGLWNKKGLFKFFNEVIKPNIFEQDYVLIYMDIDRFKSINDTYGHHVGDITIITMARFLQSTFKPKDFICRLHGDEFVVVAVGTTLDKIVPFLSQLRKDGMSLTLPEQGKIKLKFSIGATNIIANDTPEEVLSRADKAMYACKKGDGKVKLIRI